MASSHDPQSYWDQRLRAAGGLEGVGLLGAGERLNQLLYKAKVRALERGIRRLGIEFCGKKVLDLGAGVGFWVQYFLRCGALACTAIDITEVAVHSIRSKFASEKVVALQSDICDPSLTGRVRQRFDIVTALDVFYHVVDDALLRTALSNVNHLGRERSWLIFSDAMCMHRDPPRARASHVHWRSRRFWEAALGEHGFALRLQVPMYAILHPAFTGPRVVATLVNFLHYRVSRRLVSWPVLGDAYLTALASVDMALTKFAGTSLGLIFAERGAPAGP